MLGLRGKVSVMGVEKFKRGFCGKLAEASPIPKWANGSWLQDGPTTWQGKSTSTVWDNMDKKGKKDAVQQ